MRVRRLDRRYMLEDRCAPRMVFAQDVEDRELYVGAGEWLAVVKDDVTAQLEGDRAAIAGCLPTLGECGDRLAAGIVVQQAIVDLGADLRRRRTDGQVGAPE